MFNPSVTTRHVAPSQMANHSSSRNLSNSNICKNLQISSKNHNESSQLYNLSGIKNNMPGQVQREVCSFGSGKQPHKNQEPSKQSCSDFGSASITEVNQRKQALIRHEQHKQLLVLKQQALNIS